MKLTLHLHQNLPFASCPPIAELEDERILANNVIFPWENNYHQTRLWVIGNEFGAIGAVWADCEQDALDELVDAGLGDSLLIDNPTQKDFDDDSNAFLGNASEPADLTNVWMSAVLFDKQRDFDLILKFAEARGACLKTLYA